MFDTLRDSLPRTVRRSCVVALAAGTVLFAASGPAFATYGHGGGESHCPKSFAQTDTHKPSNGKGHDSHGEGNGYGHHKGDNCKPTPKPTHTKPVPHKPCPTPTRPTPTTSPSTPVPTTSPSTPVPTETPTSPVPTATPTSPVPTESPTGTPSESPSSSPTEGVPTTAPSATPSAGVGGVEETRGTGGGTGADVGGLPVTGTSLIGFGAAGATLLLVGFALLRASRRTQGKRAA
jgi:hypothetical protein